MSQIKTQNRPCIFGEVLFDCFPDGAEVLGGAPFNVAWHLQAFGCQPLFISRVGDDELGQKIKSRMQQWGMSTNALQTDARHVTGTVSISLQDGEPTFDIVADQAYDHIAADELPAIQPSLVYHGSLALREADSRNALASLRQITQAPIFMDINLRAPWWQTEQAVENLSSARWAKLNEHELAELSGVEGDHRQQAKALKSRCNLDLVIVTLGEAGAFAIGAEGETPQIKPELSQAVVDTVGAGDAFASVCILGLLNGWHHQLMLQRAQQFASAIVGIRGATPDSKEFYQPFLQQWI
jgi:fructokinase